MPYIIRRPLVRRILTTIASATLLSVAVPAVAAACTINTSGSQVFGSFGDTANYALVQNGSFEGGIDGWSLSSAIVVPGNESFFVDGASDSHSLKITPQGAAVSPPVCVGVATPSFRFFARSGGRWGQMNVNLLWTDSRGGFHTTPVGQISGTSAWAPSPSLALGSTLPLWQAGATLPVRIQFAPSQNGGSWNIDDVYIDPYSRG
jgi:hypothetical protein